MSRKENTTVAIRKSALTALHKIADSHDISLVEFLSWFIDGGLIIGKTELDELVRIGRQIEPLLEDNELEKAVILADKLKNQSIYRIGFTHE